MPGPQPGEGRAPVAERWLAIMCDLDDENEAAAAPATTRANTRALKASFIMVTPQPSLLTKKVPD
jgi:hypothetical protein